MMKNKLVIFVRAYNDLDCRVPLLLEFCKDKTYENITIIGIPSTNGINNPNSHELKNLLLENNIHVTTIYDLSSNKHALKALYFIYDIIHQNHVNDFMAKVLTKIKKYVFKIIFFLSLRDKKWIEDIIKSLNSSIVIIDEIAFQKGRSFFVDELIKNNNKYDYAIYSFLTGQDTYLNLWHDKKTENIFKIEKSLDISLFVPSQNDKNKMLGKLPNESIEVVGNTRFDSSWIKTLSEMASRKNKNDQLLRKEFNKKIVFMLSKIEYGVRFQSIIETINRCAQIENSLVVVKPHTRGMALGEFRNQLNKNVFNGSKIPSSQLIEWAETVLFTGSSIIFHAMQLEKQVVFLKYCQRYETIFDNSSSILIANEVNDVMKFINSSSKYQIDQENVNEFLLEHVYNGISSGLICKNIKEKIESLEQKE